MTEKFVQFCSIQSSIKSLLYVNDKQDISCLHFIRVLSMFLLVFYHTYLFTQAFADNAEYYRNSKLVLWQIFNNGTVHVQSFFVIGGMLSTYVPLCRWKKIQSKTNGSSPDEFRAIKTWLLMIVNRYFRLIRSYFFVMLFFTYLLPHVNQFTFFVDLEPVIQCQKNFWKHLLLIHNFNYVQNCMIWTWYTAVDFQLFFINRPVVWLFIYKPLWALVTSALLILGSSIVRTSLMLINNLPPTWNMVIEFPQYDINWMKYVAFIYAKPYTWMPSYQVGMVCGYIIYRFQFSGPLKLNLAIRLLALLSSGLTMVWTMFGVYWNANGYKNAIYDSFYVIVSPLCWSVALGWLVLEAHCFSSLSLMKLFFKLKFWIVLSNLTYGCYLINICIIFSILRRYCIFSHGDPEADLPLYWFFILFVIILIISYVAAFCIYILVEHVLEQVQVHLMKKLTEPSKKKIQISSTVTTNF